MNPENYAKRIETYHWQTYPYPTETKNHKAQSWRIEHQKAIEFPNIREAGILKMITGWLEYAEQHRRQYNGGIGEDGVLGEEWAAIGAALRGLLNGDIGRLDCGTLDGILCDTLKDEGFNPDEL